MSMSRFFLACAVAVTTVGSSCQPAAAGPLCDWLFGRHKAATPPLSYPAAATCAPACGTCQTTCTQTCQRVVVNYVPYTAYRTEWEQVPVTQYQQSTSTDPCTGCTVTCNRPCTTYTWQMKKVPYTTYRPCYRTETYSVPVTYSTPAPTCNTCPTPTAYSAPVMAAPTGCSTCNVPGTVAAPATVPANTIPTITQMPPSVLSSTAQPNYGVNPYGSYTVTPYASAEASTTNAGASSVLPATSGQPTPADQVPSLKPVIIERRELPSDPTSYQSAAPVLQPTAPAIRPIQDPNPAQRWENQQAAPGGLNDQTAQLPTHQRFDYNPVRLASYQTETPVSTVAAAAQEFHGELSVALPARSAEPLPATAAPSQANARWQTAGW